MRRRAKRDPVTARYRALKRPSASTPWRQGGWCAIDLELTGLDPARDHVIAVGAVPIEAGRVALGQARYSLVASDRPSAPGAVLTHKLRMADLAGAPPLEAALDLILDALGGRVPVFHVAAVERSFLAPPLRRRRVRLPDAADTAALGRLWLGARDGPAPQALSLEGLAGCLGLRAEAPHHALADAITTAQSFIALATHLDVAQPQTVGSLTAAGQLLAGVRRLG